jgi:hypothetical protein
MVADDAAFADPQPRAEASSSWRPRGRLRSMREDGERLVRAGITSLVKKSSA